MDPQSADQPITEARANISELIAAVQLLHRVYFLTRRETRKAALIPADLGELIEKVGGVEKAAEILRSAS
jgi:prevent-host-death family protein